MSKYLVEPVSASRIGFGKVGGSNPLTPTEKQKILNAAKAANKNQNADSDSYRNGLIGFTRIFD